ncbi:MAG TPA: hypothetical protein VFS77_15160 [Pyrinomonadaceae bacterium]|nr:hypothetical protein [Pyrinomonadaceae bacterium]
MRNYRRTLLLFVTLATLVTHISAQEQQEELANIPAVLTGVRANAVDGDVYYVREDAKFELENGLELKLGDVVRTAANGRAELLLQPGNLVRVGPDTEFQIIDDQYDRLKFQLNKGSLTFELLKNDWEDTSDFFESLKHGFELMRILTAGSEVFLTQPGIFRINATTDRTDLIVRRGEALIDGRRVKEKRIGTVSHGAFNMTETDVKNEDPFDVWSRERSNKLIEANHLLKKDSPWAKKKEGREPMVDMPSEQKGASPFVVSARPGTVNFVESAVEFSASQKPWDKLSEKTQLSTGDRVRTSDHNFVELMMFPDLHLRLDGGSEVVLEQLSNELIAVRVLRGSAILDVARFDRKELPDISISGPSTTAFVAEDGNYRVNVRLSGDEIVVRKGKVVYQDRSIGSCRILSGANTSECDRKIVDNFDVWSLHRGEGQFYTGTAMATRLAQLRRRRFKNTGFWYQHPQQSHYTFVPFFSTYFRSPYGGNYSCVLSPRRAPMFQFDPGGVRGPFRGAPRPMLAPVRP